MISVNPIVAQPEELTYYLSQTSTNSPYSLTSYNNSGNPIFISSLPINCPILSAFQRDSATAGCSPSTGSAVSLTGTQLIFDASTSFQETICIKAQTSAVTNSPTLFKLRITVCGQETLNLAFIDPSSTKFITQSGSPLVFDILDTWFVQNYVTQSSGSQEWCLRALTYEIKTGANCLNANNPSAYSVDSSTQPQKVTIHAVSPALSSTFCIKAISKGHVTATQKFEAEICGDENLTFQKDPYKKDDLTFDKTVEFKYNFTHLNDIGFEFTTDRPNCLLNFKIIEVKNGIQTELTGTDGITIDQYNGTVRVITSQAYDFRGFIRAHSLGQATIKDSKIFSITVCGYEFIETDHRFFLHASKDEGLVYFKNPDDLFTSKLQKFLNNSRCGVVSYDLVQNKENAPLDQDLYINQSMPLNEYQKQDFQLDVQKGIIQMNTSFDLEQHGFEYNGYYEFLFAIKVITRGQKVFYLMLRFIVQDLNFGNSYHGKIEDSFFIVYPLNRYHCGNLMKVKSLTFLALEGIDPDYKIMLEEIVIPSMVADQPNDEPWDESTPLVSTVSIFVLKASLKAKTFEYSVKNPDHILPINEIFIAMKTGLYFTLEGIQRDGEECKKDFGPFLEWIKQNTKDGQLSEYQAKMVSHYEDRFQTESIEAQGKIIVQQSQTTAIAQNVDIWNEEEQKIFSKLKVNDMEIISYDALLDIYMLVKFNREIKTITNDLIDELPQALSVSMRSAVDDSQFFGIFIPKSFEDGCETSRCLGSELEFSTSKNYINEASEVLQFKWKYHNMSYNEIILKIDFQYPYNISLNNFGQDEMVLSMNENDLILDADTGLPLMNSEIGIQFVHPLPQIPFEPKIQKKMYKTVSKFKSLQLFFQAYGFIAQIFFSQSIYYIWGLLNSQIIIIHMTLFNCQVNMPGNAHKFNEYMSMLTQMDLYPTDWIYGHIFNFTDKESKNEHFEILGYEGANFIDMTGSVLINILLPSTIILVQILILQVTYCCKYNKRLRVLGSNIIQKDIKNVIGPLFIIGYLELTFCAILSFLGLGKSDFRGNNGSDIFAAIFLLASMLVLVYIPLLLLFVVRKNKGNLDDPEILEKYSYLYQDLSTQSSWTASFNFVFALRRTLFVLIIIELFEYRGIQLILNLFLTVAYVIYLIHFIPYKDKQHNRYQIFNECCVLLVSYFLMWYSIFPGLDIQYVQLGKTIGWFYIFAASLNLLINILKIGNSLVFSFPSIYRHLKQRFYARQYDQKKVNFHKLKEVISKRFPESVSKQIFFEESKKILVRDKYRQELKKLKIQQIKQAQWMKRGDIGNKVFRDYLRRVFQHEQDALELKYYGEIKRENDQMGIIDVKLQVSNLVGGTFIHNDVNLLIGRPPYDERKYQKIQQTYENLPMSDPDNVRMMNEEVLRAQTISLLKFLQRQHYQCVKIDKDGNCGAKAISVRYYGNPSSHKLVRKEMCAFMAVSLNQKFSHDLEGEAYKSKLEYIQKMKKDGVQFTELELKVCSHLYEFPIVTFSIENKMMFFDYLVTPIKKTQVQNCPLYILKHEGYLTPLIHRGQKRLLQFFEQHGTSFEKFKARHFFDDKSYPKNCVRQPKGETDIDDLIKEIVDKSIKEQEFLPNQKKTEKKIEEHNEKKLVQPLIPNPLQNERSVSQNRPLSGKKKKVQKGKKLKSSRQNMLIHDDPIDVYIFDQITENPVENTKDQFQNQRQNFFKVEKTPMAKFMDQRNQKKKLRNTFHN